MTGEARSFLDPRYGTLMLTYDRDSFEQWSWASRRTSFACKNSLTSGRMPLTDKFWYTNQLGFPTGNDAGLSSVYKSREGHEGYALRRGISRMHEKVP